MSAPRLEARWHVDPDGKARLTSPAVGRFRPLLRVGAVVQPGDVLGQLDVLGNVQPVHAPAATRGQLRALPGATADVAVGYDGRLYAVDATATPGLAGLAAEAPTAASADGLVFRAPTSGRFYRRASPDKPPFVEAGTELAVGGTVCLLEVMKTFNRITYGGDDLPPRACVVAVLVGDGDDVNRGDPLLRLEPR
jgi:acetyl-CoA carboxylase biotin carboxyl carrier protein